MRSRPSIPVGQRSGDGRCSLNSSHSDIRLDRLSRRTSRKHHRETRALTESTVNGHRAAHREADVPHNPEPDAEAATPGRPLARSARRASTADPAQCRCHGREPRRGRNRDRHHRDFDGVSRTESNRIREEISIPVPRAADPTTLSPYPVQTASVCTSRRRAPRRIRRSLRAPPRRGSSARPGDRLS